ncbi:helix-turn-helix domain-containing protein [Kordia sp.]|uniref:helix-turn-helix domain-containing protein n=1 Tax=Kordia sp. TaxID=1965332 RepID=UPI0025C20AC4|nr:helix-turn-helix domain-containing protein [Kordia sp.]MCH2196576.1 helix-turn-helix domain-containing protein [Kordia sp.]
MITKTIQIQEITLDELADKVSDKLLDKIKHYLDEFYKNESDVFLTRQETASFLKINITTLWNWTKKGKIKSYGIGNRVYHNKQEILDLLNKNKF